MLSAIYNLIKNITGKKTKNINQPGKPSGLFYDKMPGAAGHIYCKKCSYIVLVDVARMSYSPEVHIKTFYQCLDCGKFTNLSFRKGDTMPSCSCGGKLSKTHELFLS